jgi:hypothetical protein
MNDLQISLHGKLKTVWTFLVSTLHSEQVHMNRRSQDILLPGSAQTHSTNL